MRDLWKITSDHSLDRFTYHHLVFLSSLEATLRVHHPRVWVDFKLALAAAALDAVLDLSIVADVFIVREYLSYRNTNGQMNTSLLKRTFLRFLILY